MSNMRCWVAGWGASSFTAGSSQSIQTHVDVPLVDQATCQSKLRTTKLGSSFVLDTYSFLCAGGEAGKGEFVVNILSKYFDSKSFPFVQTRVLEMAEVHLFVPSQESGM